MKQKDIALIVVVAIVAGVFSLLLTQVLFTPKNIKQLKAETVDPIKADFNKPDGRVFNKDAINPTKLLQIGDSSNPEPF